jgi:pimeloyl-ACP methyl ester carboxylesterase
LKGAPRGRPCTFIVKVDVGGRQLNLYCTGKGTPTVLFEADTGRAGWDWSAVQPEVARRTRACVYDRAGMGFSDPATRASSVGNASRDLNFLIKNARIDGPVVLVGAGFGAMVAQQFAARPRGGIAGLVLVEPPQDEALAAPQAAALDAAAQHLASLSTRGRSVALPDGGQPILFAQPEAVTAAVLQVLQALETPEKPQS